MSQTKKKPAQLELFADHGEIHELGLLGWEDALWTKPIEIRLLSGETLLLNLETIRRLQRLKLPVPAESAAGKPSAS
jgi:hypothetical protein